MEKDIGKIKKNGDTDIIVRIDDFGGRVGLTIREFVNGSDGGYTGFTKSGTRIPLESIEEFKTMVNSIKPEDLRIEGQKALPAEGPAQETPQKNSPDSGVADDGTI